MTSKQTVIPARQYGIRLMTSETSNDLSFMTLKAGIYCLITYETDN